MSILDSVLISALLFHTNNFIRQQKTPSTTYDAERRKPHLDSTIRTIRKARIFREVWLIQRKLSQISHKFQLFNNLVFIGLQQIVVSSRLATADEFEKNQNSFRRLFIEKLLLIDKIYQCIQINCKVIDRARGHNAGFVKVVKYYLNPI